VAALDPSLPVQQPMTLDAVVGDGLASRKLPAALMGAFGVSALLLASLGVYAMFANLAAAREREFGVRMALGSRPRAIAALMLRQGASWATAGLTCGALGSIAIVRLLRSAIDGVPPFAPADLAVSIAMLIVCATVALAIPVRRATRIDPITALRAE
jgi:putative ABC transport system permease protein